MTEKERQRQEAITQLQQWIKPGDIIWTTIKHVSPSGMYRTIAVHLIEENQPRLISFLVAKAIGARFDEKREAVGIGGCGMDMGFALVYALSRVLFKDGFRCIGKGDTYRCRSNEHSNERKPNFRKGRLHSDPGYALTHRWL